MSAVEARRLIKEGVIRAVEKHKKSPMKPLTVPGPFVLEKKFFHTHVADMMESNPLAERVDPQTVRYESDDILEVIYA